MLNIQSGLRILIERIISVNKTTIIRHYVTMEFGLTCDCDVVMT